MQSSCSALVVLVNVYHMTGYGWYPPFDHGSVEATAMYNDAIRRLAERTNCLYADVYAAEDRADWVVHQDGVHANKVGNLLIANRIFEVLATHCSGLSAAIRQHDEQTPWTEATRQKRHAKVEPVKKP